MESYSRHANCYITKPVDVDNFKKAIQSIGIFWMEIAKLPKVQIRTLPNSAHNALSAFNHTRRLFSY